MADDRTLSSAVARRKGEVSETAAIEADIRKSREWFDTVAPKHIDAAQFVNLCLSQVRRGSNELKTACVQSPWTFMEAASECARLGLVPGETYHFVPFKDNKSHTYQVVGIVDYKGEIDQIYRAGGVRAVHVQAVRARDTFIWRPGQMQLPHHIIHAPEPPADLKIDEDIANAMRQQEGLASDAERGPLTGVYAYAEMIDGGFSQPIVMSVSTVMKHRAVAKTDKFWGPKWPAEGPWTEDMWNKTAVHKLFDRVPHSAEYLAERLRSAAAVVTDTPPAVVGKVEPPAVTAGDPEPPGADGEKRAKALDDLRAVFKQHGITGAQSQAVIVSGLLYEQEDGSVPRVIGSLTELPAGLLEQAGAMLAEFCKNAPNPGEALKQYANQIADTHPPQQGEPE